MTGAAPSVGRAPGRAPVLAVTAVCAIAAATAWAALSVGHPAATAAPVVLALLAWTAWRAPLRASAAVLLLLVLALDDFENANGLWHSPLAGLGDLVHHSMQSIFPSVKGLALTGTELGILLLLAVAAWRSSTGAPADRPAAPPRALAAVGGAYLGAILLATANGLARGGDAEVAVWQTRPLLETAALTMVFLAALRERGAEVLAARVVVLAAVVRAALAAWVRWVVAPGTTFDLEYATDHGDSMLFTLAFVLVAAHLLERRDRARAFAALAVLPVLLVGIHANGRRTAWLQLALGLLLFLVVARGAAWRRQLGRAALVALPFLVLYGAAGWSSTSAAFRPVQLVRSVTDSTVDRSTWDRQVENWNLAMSMRDRPLLGRGFGHEWTEYFAGDAITEIFHRYRAHPHNQLLGVLLFAGPLGFAAIWAPFAVLVLAGVRAYPRARTPEQRATALAVAATSVVVGVQCFSDLGPFWPQYAVLTALALAAAGRLATETGAAR
ncbi:MAG TPA: O-antigen ligase family protein [Anaeromyxobacter sp.]|nr:O-antigen ligase family protein [Anaeromyxobacter sp.]